MFFWGLMISFVFIVVIRKLMNRNDCLASAIQTGITMGITKVSKLKTLFFNTFKQPQFSSESLYKLI